MHLRTLVSSIAFGLAPCASTAGMFALDTNLKIEIAGIGVVSASASAAVAQSDGHGEFAENTVGDYGLSSIVPITPPLLGDITAAWFSDSSPGVGQFDSPPIAAFPLVQGTFGGTMDLSGFAVELFIGGSSAGTIAGGFELGRGAPAG